MRRVYCLMSWVYITADGQSASSSCYRVSLWSPWPDLSFSSFFFWLAITFIRFPIASSLTRKWVCSLESLHSLVRSLTTSNHTLPSHPRLCSLSVASYDSQGLRWKYSNPPPHGELSDGPNSRAYIHSQFAGRGSIFHADWPDDRSWWPLKGPFQAWT
jgi:hypothetical protein